MTSQQVGALAGIQVISPATSNRVPRSFASRIETAGHDAFIPAPAQIDNGDEALYSDKSGTYTKGILQAGVGLVDLAAYQTFKTALNSGDPADFEAITIGGTRTQNGPQGGLASIWNAWIAANSQCHRRQPCRARTTPRNWWKCTGLRCCEMSRSLTTPRIL